MELIGRLRSGLCTFVGGHLYYNKDVIKIRYDLIKRQQDHHLYKDIDVFDFYNNIFQLKKGNRFRVMSNTPLDSILSHKFVYIIID